MVQVGQTVYLNEHGVMVHDQMREAPENSVVAGELTTADPLTVREVNPVAKKALVFSTFHMSLVGWFYFDQLEIGGAY